MRGFGELEATVMDRLWEAANPQSVREVLTDLEREREIAYTTVMTVMERLFRKGLLTREADGRAYRYTPAMTRADYTSRVMAEALRGTNDRAAALVYFADRVTTSQAKTLVDALLARAQRPGGRP